MMAQMWEGVRRGLWWGNDLLERLRGASYTPKDSGSSEILESAVRSALRPVAPSANFREVLRNNLSFAAQGQRAGPTIEYPKPFREGILLGVSVGLLVATVATLVLVFRSRLSGSEG